LYIILQLNKRKCLFWCREQLWLNETFDDVIFTDETTIQLEQHSCICFRKRFHPCVYLGSWSWYDLWPLGNCSLMNGTRPACKICFSCCAFMFPVNITGLVAPFLEMPPHVWIFTGCFGCGFKASEYISDFFDEEGNCWWATLPESPDLNLIELIWGSLKQYLQA